MKKLISLFSAAIMALSLMLPSAYAENTDNTMKTVLESVKQRVEIPSECTEFESESETMYGITAYNFGWRNKNGDKYVNINCFDDGVITYYYNSNIDVSNDNPTIPKISSEDAKKSAEDFANKLNPNAPYELKIKERANGLYTGGYGFTTEIYVNGVHFYSGDGYMNVDGETGKVSQYSADYIPMNFPSVENAISVEDAKKAYSEKLGLELIYRTYTDDNGKDTAYPVYVQKTNTKYINALTGEIFDMSVSRGETSGMGGMSNSMKDEMTQENGLSEQEIKELENINGLISKTDIEKQVRNNKVLSIPKSVSVDSINLTKQYKKDVYIYSISMSDSKDTNIYIRLNAKTGEILTYHRNTEKNNNIKNQNDKDFKALAGDKSGEYKYNEENKRYDRYVNGIRVEGDSAYMTYSQNVLTNYSIGYTDAEFGAISDVMSVSDAEKIMFEKDGYEMKYIQIISDKEIKAVPLYVHETVSINPFTGKYVNYRNEEITEDEGKLEYSDISGHYAEYIIKKLAYFGVGFEGGQFKPDEKITQKDFLALLTSLYRNGIIVAENDTVQSDDVYTYSIRKNIISEDERDDNAYVTRENSAIYTIRAIGAEDYAKYNDIYVTPFADVTQNKGYIALLSAMGIVGGDENGNFNPNNEITRAQSAVMIYNYLTK